MNSSTEQKQTQNKLVVAMWEREGVGIQQVLFVQRMQIVIHRWINNKVLPYSTGNYIQYPMTNHNGEYEKECVCITELLCFAAEINTL